MPEIGDKIRANQIGKKANHGNAFYIWAVCTKCGERYWVRFIKGKDSHICRGCTPNNLPHNGIAEQNSHWNGDSIIPHTGRQRAKRWYPLKPCAVCGRTDVGIDRHHIDGNALNNNPENIFFLCRYHHMEVDGRIYRRNGGRFATSKKPVDRICEHCGDTEDVALEYEHVCEHGMTDPHYFCKDRVACWKRWDEQHGIDMEELTK